MPSASASAVQDPPQTPRASSWLPSQSQSPSGMSAQPPRRSLGPVADPAGVQGPDTIVDIVADAIGIGVGRAGPTTGTEASSWLPSRSQSPSGMSAQPLVDLSGPLQTPQASRAPTQSSTSSQMPSASASAVQDHHRHRGHRAGCRHSRNHLRGCRRSRTRRSLRAVADPQASGTGSRRHRRGCHRHRCRPCRTHHRHRGHRAGCRHRAITFGDVGAAALVDLSGPLQTPQASRAPTQSSTSSRMPSASVSAVRDPPQTPRASAGCRHSRNHLRGCRAAALVDLSGPLQTPQASRAPTQSSTSSQMPSASASAVQDPPQTPRASSWLPSQSQSPSGMSAQPHS